MIGHLWSDSRSEENSHIKVKLYSSQKKAAQLRFSSVFAYLVIDDATTSVFSVSYQKGWTCYFLYKI